MMINVDPGALSSVAVLAGSVVAGLVARRGIARLDQRRDERGTPERVTTSTPPPVVQPRIRPAVPMRAHR